MQAVAVARGPRRGSHGMRWRVAVLDRPAGPGSRPPGAGGTSLPTAPMSDELAPSELSTSLEEVRDDRAVLRVAGEVDLLTAPQLGEALAAALAPGRVVVADLAGVTFMDSTGLRTLLEAHRGATDAGGGVAVR